MTTLLVNKCFKIFKQLAKIDQIANHAEVKTDVIILKDDPHFHMDAMAYFCNMFKNKTKDIFLEYSKPSLVFQKATMHLMMIRPTAGNENTDFRRHVPHTKSK